MKYIKLTNKKFFTYYFQETIKCINKGYTECAKLYLENIRGALSLLEFTSQITEENYNRINKLTHIIRKKYKLY